MTARASVYQNVCVEFLSFFEFRVLLGLQELHRLQEGGTAGCAAPKERFRV